MKREIGDLEKEYINLILGNQTSNDDLTQYVREFVNRSFKEKELLENLKNKANEIYFNTMEEHRKTYLEIYSSLLITEIRNLKIDKIC